MNVLNSFKWVAQSRAFDGGQRLKRERKRLWV